MEQEKKEFKVRQALVSGIGLGVMGIAGLVATGLSGGILAPVVVVAGGVSVSGNYTSILQIQSNLYTTTTILVVILR